MNISMSTNYLGLDLSCPIVASASPVTGRIDSLRRLEDAGVGAVVLPSLFEEQIEYEEMAIQALHDFGAESFGEATGGYFPELEGYNTGPDRYLELVRTAKEKLDIPVIASLNGTSVGGWLHHAKLLEEAGADAIELNVYFVAADIDEPSAQVEARYLDIVRAVRVECRVPLAVKVPPFFSSPGWVAKRLVEAGAGALVLFNRFFQPEIDLDRLAVAPKVDLSSPADLRLPLRWIAILSGRIPCFLAGTSGVHGAPDALKMLLAGADVAMMASSLLRHGPEHVRTVLNEMQAWLTEREYTSVEQMRGSLSQRHCPDPAAFERANYMAALTSYTTPDAV